MLAHVKNLFFIALNFVPHFAELLKALPPTDWTAEGDAATYNTGRSGAVTAAPSGPLQQYS
jgi:hypothetical protein